MGNTRGIHLGKTYGQIALRTCQRQWNIRSHAADLGVDTDDPLFDLRPIGEARIRQPPQQRQRHGVCVYVRCLHLLHHALTTLREFSSPRMAQFPPGVLDPQRSSIEWEAWPKFFHRMLGAAR